MVGTVAVFACGSLPDIASGCGNSIVEDGEDCDRFGDKATNAACRPPGSAGECRFDCTTNAAGDGGLAQACPTGFRCGSDFICRKPGGKFEPPISIPSLADSVLIADFDGNNVNDILARSRVDLTVYYGDSSSKFGTSFTIPAADVSPAVGILTGDPSANLPADIAYGISDLGGPITVWQGLTDQSLVATPYPALSFPSVTKDLAFQPRFMTIEVLSQQPAQEVIVFLPVPTGTVIHLTSIGVGGNSGEVDLFRLPIEPRKIVGLEKGQIVEDPVTSPCEDFVVGATDETSIHVYTPCNGPNPNPLGPGQITFDDVRLDSGKVGTGGLHLLDLNADGHLDIMVDVAGIGPLAASTVQVAFGRGDGTFGSAPTGIADSKTAVSNLVPSYPLAVAQMTNDSLVDFVLPGSISVTRAAGEAGPQQTEHVNAPRGVNWNEAHILDLNGDGTLDVIASSTSGSIDVYTSGPDSLFNHSTYAAEGPAQNFVFGDFDGDYNIDTAFVALGVGEGDTLSIMFGQQKAAPEAPVRITHFDHIEQLGSGELQTAANGSAPDAVTDLGVVWRNADASQQNISLLQGSTDRQIQAPFPLQLGQAGVAVTSGALGLTLGRFTQGTDGNAIEPRHADIAAVGIVPVGASPTQVSIRFWRSQMSQVAALGADPATMPPPPDAPMTQSDAIETYDKGAISGLAGAVKPIHDWTRVQVASVDLHGATGASIDELVVLAPPAQDGAGTLYIERPVSGIFRNLMDPINLGPDRIDGHRSSWRLGSVDLNADFANEIVVFVDGKDASVKVFWNRRTGNFDGNATLIALPSPFPACARLHASECNRPIGFAAVNADSDPQKELFILTAEHIFSAKNTPGSDDFKVSDTPVIDIPSGIEPTSIAAGDVDGDGIDDVIVTSPRALLVFNGECAGSKCDVRVTK